MEYEVSLGFLDSQEVLFRIDDRLIQVVDISNTVDKGIETVLRVDPSYRWNELDDNWNELLKQVEDIVEGFEKKRSNCMSARKGFTRVTADIPEQIVKDLDKLANSNLRSRSMELVMAIQEWIKKNKEGNNE